VTEYVKHKFRIQCPFISPDQLEELKPYIPPLVEDARDNLADTKFGVGKWRPGSLSIDYTVHEHQWTDEDEETGEITSGTTYYLIAKGFVWGAPDDE
jgi:hypothetical protein